MLSKRAAVGLAAALCFAGCSDEDTEQLAKVARKSAAKVDAMTGGAPDKLATSVQAVRTNWNEIALDTRVSVRLRWDKDLEGAVIRAHAAQGVVELKGTVTSMTQRQRAVQLARTTVGVSDVVDALEVVEAAP
jgi:osmotically-inducible protein OsmY